MCDVDLAFYVQLIPLPRFFRSLLFSLVFLTFYCTILLGAIFFAAPILIPPATLLNIHYVHLFGIIGSKIKYKFSYGLSFISLKGVFIFETFHWKMVYILMLNVVHFCHFPLLNRWPRIVHHHRL